LRVQAIPRSWLVMTGMLAILELAFLYEAMLADVAGYEKIFGIFAGLAILCFAAILYLAVVVFYGWD